MPAKKRGLPMEFERSEIVELLDLQGWSQGELARRLQVESSTVGRWINGATVPSGATQMLLRLWLDEARSEGSPATKSKRTA